MNKQGNTYTIIYTSVMVIAVAFILAFAAIGLKPAQERNIAIDKMSQILNSVNIASTPENTQELYGKYIDDSYNQFERRIGKRGIFLDKHCRSTETA